MKDCISLTVGMAVILFFIVFIIIPPIFRRFFSRITIFEFQKGLRYSRGKFDCILEPGQYWI